MLREYGYSTGVARLLTKLTTRKGLLPQGAPTSTVIANLVLARSVDEPTQMPAERAGTAFTRYVDDFSLSGDNPAAHIGDIACRLSLCGSPSTGAPSSRFARAPCRRQSQVSTSTVVGRLSRANTATTCAPQFTSYQRSRTLQRETRPRTRSPVVSSMCDNFRRARLADSRVNLRSN